MEIVCCAAGLRHGRRRAGKRWHGPAAAGHGKQRLQQAGGRAGVPVRRGRPPAGARKSAPALSPLPSTCVVLPSCMCSTLQLIAGSILPYRCTQDICSIPCPNVCAHVLRWVFDSRESTTEHLILDALAGGGARLPAAADVWRGPSRGAGAGGGAGCGAAGAAGRRGPGGSSGRRDAQPAVPAGRPVRGAHPQGHHPAGSVCQGLALSGTYNCIRPAKQKTLGANRLA